MLINDVKVSISDIPDIYSKGVPPNIARRISLIGACPSPRSFAALRLRRSIRTECDDQRFATAFVGAGARRRLGFLAVGDESGQALNQAELVLLDELRNHGWIDGGNLSIEYRFSQPPDRLRASVTDLIALSPDLLVAAGPQAANALKSATATLPIVFVAVADPVGLGLVQSPIAKAKTPAFAEDIADRLNEDD